MYYYVKNLQKKRSKTSIIILYMRNEGSLSRHYYCVYRTSSGYYSLNRYNENTRNEIFSWKYFENLEILIDLLELFVSIDKW